MLLSLSVLAGVLALVADVDGAREIQRTMQATAAITPLFWLAPPVERLIALLVHASTRALVLLGVARGKPLMVSSGFLLFAAIDGVAGAFIVAGGQKRLSTWWLLLAVLPLALVSIPILQWCYRRWTGGAEIAEPPGHGPCVDEPSPEGRS